jgi:Cytochrome c biogenesis protein
METLQTQLYELAQFANNLVNTQLTHLSLVSVGVIFLAGLLTSLTPCMLSMLPITIGYIGGYEAKSRLQAAAQSAWFSLGLATTLAGLGHCSIICRTSLRQNWAGFADCCQHYRYSNGAEFTRSFTLANALFRLCGVGSERFACGGAIVLIGLNFWFSSLSVQHAGFSYTLSLGFQNGRYSFRWCVAAVLRCWVRRSANNSRYFYCQH